MITYSIIKKSQLEGAKRLDAEYYQPEYLELEKRFDALETKTIDEISKSVISFGAYSLTSHIEWQESGVPYVNVGDIHDGYIDFSNVKYISERVDEILKKSRINNGQVLLTMAGTIGNAAVVYNLPQSGNANQAIAKITPSDIISPYYLAAFLNSKYGLLQTQREIVSSVQANIFLGPIKKFKVPIFDRKMTEEVESKYQDFLKELEKSKSLYSQAENLLLEELGLKNFNEGQNLYSVVNLSNIKKANRIDAEYFQPKYAKIISKLRNGIVKSLSEISTLIGHPTQSPYDEHGTIAVLAQKHMRHGLMVDTSTFDNYTTEDLIKKNDKKFILKRGDILISSAGEPGLTCIWAKEGKVIPGSFVTIARLKNELEPLYVGVFLNTIAGRLQFEREYTGSIQQYVYPVKMKNILIPILPKPTQQKIAELVRKSHESRKKAKELLKEAKHKVEELIEKVSGL